jgi:hypothetical protein
MSVTQSKTGRFGTGSVNSVVLNITAWSAKVHKEFAISTDSGNYDSGTQQLWRSRKPGEVWVEGHIEGNYDFSGSTDANLTQLYKSDGPYPLSLGFDRSTTFCSCNADFDEAEFTVTVNGANMITFSTPFMSNGVVTLP